jgi:hypothetical protein
MPSINASIAHSSTSITRPSHPEIARCAAQLWEERGRPNDRDEEIWLHAEQQLLNAQGHSQLQAARSAQPNSAAKGGSLSKPRVKSVRTSGWTQTNPVPPLV